MLEIKISGAALSIAILVLCAFGMAEVQTDTLDHGFQTVDTVKVRICIIYSRIIRPRNLAGMSCLNILLFQNLENVSEILFQFLGQFNLIGYSSSRFTCLAHGMHPGMYWRFSKNIWLIRG